MKNKKILIFVFFLILNFLPQVFVLVSTQGNLLNWYKTDDAFYYFKTAQNIAEGNGITFDRLAPTNGFHPLWMIICIPVFALAKYDLYLPLRVLAAIQILLNAASGYLLYVIFYEKISKTTAWIAAIFWMFYPPIHELTTNLGLETGLSAFMLIAFIYLLSRRLWSGENENQQHNLIRVGLCGAGVLLSRLDNIFLLIMVGLWLVFQGKKINKFSQIDFILILFSAAVSFFIRLGSSPNIFDYVSFQYILIGLSLVIKPTLLYFFKCYESNKEKSSFRILIKVLYAITLSSGLIFILLLLLQDVLLILKGFPRSAVAIEWALSLLLLGGHHLYEHTRSTSERSSNEDISLKTNWRIWAGRGLGYFTPIAITLIIYLIFNYSYVGTPMPVSGQIKRWWGTLPNTVYGRPITTLLGMVKGLFDPSKVSGPFWLLTQPLDIAASKLQTSLGFSETDNFLAQIFFVLIIWAIFLAGVYLLTLKQSEKFRKYAHNLALLPIFTGAFFHAVSYKSTGYLHVREWYWIGEMLLIFLFFCILFSILLDIIEKKLLHSRLTGIFAFLLCGTLWGMFSASIIQRFPLDGQVPYDYDIDGEVQFITSNTKPGDVIGMTGGGLTAYFVPGRVILNLDGLINSADYFDKLQNGKTTEYLIENKVKYIYGEELILLDSDPYRWFFTEKLSHLAKGPFFHLYAYQTREAPFQ